MRRGVRAGARARAQAAARAWLSPARPRTQGLDKLEMVTLPSGLKYRDIVVGTGPSPEPGFQARALAAGACGYMR